MDRNDARRLDSEVAAEFFGCTVHMAEIQGAVSAVRVRKSGAFWYLPEYSTNMRESWLIVDAIVVLGGEFHIETVTKGREWAALAVIGTASFTGIAGTPETAICDLALTIARHPLFASRLQPKIEEKEEIKRNMPQSEGPTSLKGAWYDAQ